MFDFPNHKLHAGFGVFDTVVPFTYLKLKLQYLIHILIESINYHPSELFYANIPGTVFSKLS